MLKILLFIRIFYKQQGSILRCFSRLKFEKSLFSNTFFQFLNKMIVYTAEKGQIKYFAQNWPGKIAFFIVQTAACFSCCCHNLLFSHLGDWRVLKCITLSMTTTPERIGTSKHKKIKTILTSPTFTNHLTTWTKLSSESNKYTKFSVKLTVSHGWKLEQSS